MRVRAATVSARATHPVWRVLFGSAVLHAAMETLSLSPAQLLGSQLLRPPRWLARVVVGAAYYSALLLFGVLL